MRKVTPKVTKVWTATLQEIEGSEDCFLPIPDDIGWKEGDGFNLTVVDDEEPPYMIIKKV